MSRAERGGMLIGMVRPTADLFSQLARLPKYPLDVDVVRTSGSLFYDAVKHKYDAARFGELSEVLKEIATIAAQRVVSSPKAIQVRAA